MEHEDGTLLKRSVEKRSGRPTLLDSGEDFEMLEEVDDGVGDDLPPLEDAGGGKKESHEANKTVNEITDPSQGPHQEEWMDVLGMQGYTIP